MRPGFGKSLTLAGGAAGSWDEAHNLIFYKQTELSAAGFVARDSFHL
jgi:hypothetical protein